MLTKLSTFRGVSPTGEPLVQVFRQGASIEKTAGHLMPEIQEWLTTYKSDKDNIALLINALGASEVWGQNINGDIFPWGPLQHDCRKHTTPHPVDSFTGKPAPPYGYWTFLKAHPYAHHRNKDPNRAFGKVVVSCLNPRMKRVELAVLLNRKAAIQHGGAYVVERIDSGEYPDTSMGCFPARSMVTMADGTRKPIEEVVAGDMVLTHLGRPKRVVEVHSRIYRGDLYAVKAESHETVWCTRDHPFYSVQDSQVKTSDSYRRWKKDIELSPEWVHAKCIEDAHLLSPIDDSVSTPDYVSEAFARFFGYYLAEGHVLRNKKKEIVGVEFSTHVDDIFHSEIDALCETIGTKNPPATVGREHSEYGMSTVVFDKRVAELCFEHGGGYAKHKRLSTQAMHWHPDLQRHVIGAYANGDGHGTSNGELKLSSSSTNLAWQVLQVLARIGIPASINNLEHKAGSGFSTHVTYEWVLHVGKLYAQTLKDVCGKVAPAEIIKARRARIGVEHEEHKYICTPVREISSIYSEIEVFNLEVEEDESYIVGGLAVHNCKVPYDVCAICGHKSKTRNEYCDCVRKIGMGTILPDGRRVGVENLHPRFFDISFVFIGADPTSKVMAKLGSLWVPQSIVDADNVYGIDPSQEVEAGLTKAAQVYSHSRPANSHGYYNSEMGSSRLEKTSSISIGPPPSPNRKEHPYEGSADFQGLRIYIENKVGSVREGKGWRTVMKNPYGEILGTKGTDKDRLDVYLGPNANAKDAYVVHQNDPRTGKYDEDKAMLGFDSPEEAKRAYLSHYSNPAFFRSMTILDMDKFKKMIRGEAKGEKVASLEKIAVDLKLEDLFSAPNALRRERTWRDKTTGAEVNVTGSGLEKDAGDFMNSITEAAVKMASHDKWADIVKKIGPGKVVGKVSPLLSEREQDLPKEVLDDMGKMDLQKALATPSLMGMALKPREFQRIILVRGGRPDLADDFDSKGMVFRMKDGEDAPCSPLMDSDFSENLMKALLPFLEDRSYLHPVMERRIIRISIMKPKKYPEKNSDSPLLSKVASAYNWYRREMVKVATLAPKVAASSPALIGGIQRMGSGGVFNKARLPDKRSLLMIAGSIPLSLMYSAHLQSKERKGGDLNTIEQLIARHPWLTTMGGAAAVRQIMKTPQAQKATDELGGIGKRILLGPTA